MQRVKAQPQPHPQGLQSCRAVFNSLTDLELDQESVADSSLQARMVQWYPGHIARAERQLREQLKLVDVVLEVRDARIPLSTCHPQIPQWCGSKPRLLVLNRVDMISPADQQAWANYFAQQHLPVFWTNGMDGTGITKVVRAAVSLSKSINSKRSARGLKPRAVRAVAVGFPNVGKSALINRLVNKRACDSAPKPGVTRQLRWVRIGGDLDILDAPGVLPMSFNDQIAAQRLAMCNDIGEAAYVDSLVAAALLDTLVALPNAPDIQEQLQRRFGMELPPEMTGEAYVEALAVKLFQSEKEKAGQRILKDFRSTALGTLALELPHMQPAHSAPRQRQ
ncbi:hypothetical protein WJX72_007411 [[Myrmecia] bisecta]|uniref:Mitochondrial GTPase 1 n=1 Tax=[Myrmecia] bisecta TaxID=41462 RepID=A0AAW1PUQ5_9CHLO